MCGIAGFIRATPGSDSPAVLDRMTGSIRHRGPDGSGAFRDPFASLGHRRLSIIDVAGGGQPMFSEDGNLAIVFNGEIFNHADLRPELEAAGHCYTTHCDTETIVHSFEQYGPACLSRFRGMFSFAIWDRGARKLFCARDRLGIKPFYYYFDGRLFVFASEIKALLEHPAISARFEQHALPEYLAFGYLSGDRTLFAGIRKLMPGHYLTVEPAAGGRLSLRIEQYWDLPASGGDAHQQSDSGWIKECRQRLEETVRMRLMSDVPLGMFLSGGVDSSAIAALMKHMVSGPVKTFAVGYAEAAYSELGYARQVATHIGADHHEVSVGMEDFFDALPRLIWHEDEPITWPSSVSLYFVSRLASRQVKVVLTGEGSDELFAGYARYRFYDLNRRYSAAYGALPSFARSWVRERVADSSLLSASLRRKLQHTFVGRGESIESLYLDNFYSAFPSGEQEALLSIPPTSSPYAAFLSYWNARADLPLIPHMLFADQKTYLVELLMKQDQMSMAASIESRVPFLDHPFVEFAARVPWRLKLHGGTGKHIFKEAVRDLLPPEIIHRKKMGFPTPLRQWLLDPRSAGIYSRLRSRDGLLASCLNSSALNSLLDRHTSGAIDATDRIWRLLNLQIWGDVFLGGKSIGEASSAISGGALRS